MTQPSAEQVILKFYRRCGAPAPTFEFGTSGDADHRPVHTCTLTLADAVWEGQPVPGDQHIASAERRKVARVAAAEAALEALRDHPAFEAAQDAAPERVHESPLATLATMLSDEEVRRNTEVEAALLLAQRFADGWLPLPSLLAPARRTLLSQWCRCHLPSSLQHDQAGLLYELRCRLASEPPLPGGTLEFDGDYSAVRQTQAYIPSAGSNSSAALEASLELAAHRNLVAVLLPADTSVPPTEVSLDGSAYYLDAVAAALGCEPNRIWHWGIANRNFRTLAPLAVAAAVAAGAGGAAATEWADRSGGDAETVDAPDDLELSLCQQLGYPSPSAQPQPEPEPPPEHPGLFCQADERPLVGLTKGLTGTQRVTAEDLAAAVADKQNEAPASKGATGWPSRASLHPSMYSALPAADEPPQPWNARAGWVTGKAVRGDVLLARVRPRPWVLKLGEKRRSHPVLRADSYPVSELAAAAAACAPSQLYARHLGASFVARLPTSIRSCDAWPGRLPKALLGEIGTPGVLLPGGVPASGLPADHPHAATSAEAECGSKRKSSDTPQDLCGPVHKAAALGSGQTAGAAPLCSLGGASVDLSQTNSGDELAEQQDALQTLHTLQQQHAAAWGAAFPAPGTVHGPCSQQAAATGSVAKSRDPSSQAAAVADRSNSCMGDVQLLQGGRGLHRPIQHGSRVKVAYAVTAVPAAGSEQLLLERHDGFTFEWGSNGVLPEAEAAAAAVAMHGFVRCSVEVTFPAGSGRGGSLLPGTLALRLLDVAPPLPVPSPGPLFAPPAAAQRYALVASLAVAAGAKTLVDLGCGDGKLIQHLASDNAVSAAALERVMGVDISATALVRGRKTLQLDQQLAQAVGAPRPRVDLVLADMCQAQPGDWGELLGTDAAAMVEVVEHLDPDALLAAGPALLGGLRPKIAIVTTPNIEYNPVMAAAGGGQLLLHNGLRNRDHRFEWTRAEFEGWARPLAAAHGYEVHFEGVGRLRPEILKAMPPAFADVVAAEPGLGCATQVAMFVQRKS